MRRDLDYEARVGGSPVGARGATHPELEALGNNRLGNASSRSAPLESTVQEARDAREAIVGSFDVLIARTGHRTNDIMKVLTLTP